MRDLIILFVHVIVTICRLLRPSGARSIIAESILLKQQLLILNRSRKRAPNLRASATVSIAGVCSMFMKSSRLISQRIFDCSLYLHHARQEYYCRKQIRVSHLFSIFCVSADSPGQMGLVFTMRLPCCYKCNPYNRFEFQFAMDRFSAAVADGKDRMQLRSILRHNRCTYCGLIKLYFEPG